MTEAMTPGVLAVALLTALAAGAFHALAPGHGKTVVAAYLVGARGTVRHALILGLVVTATHVAAVFVLGLGVLMLGGRVSSPAVIGWLGYASGLMILAIGLHQLSSRVTALAGFKLGGEGGPGVVGNAGHSHVPTGGVTWGSLVALGVSGGLVPCPSALVVMLGAIGLGRTAFGIVLVTVFSLGLALTLTTIGLVMVFARSRFERTRFEVSWGRRAGVVSAVVVTVAGGLLAWSAFPGWGS